MMPNNAHGDSRNITTLDLQGAASAADTTVPHVVSNVVRTLALWRGRSAGNVAQATKELDESGADVAYQMVKAAEEQRYTLGLAYPHDRADVSTAADGFRDFVSAPTLEIAAWSFMAKGAEVGLLHRDGSEGHGIVVESYIYRGPDWHIKAIDGSDQVITAGDWLLGHVWDEVAWKAIKSRLLNGLSPQGPVRRRKPSPHALANLRRA